MVSIKALTSLLANLFNKDQTTSFNYSQIHKFGHTNRIVKLDQKLFFVEMLYSEANKYSSIPNFHGHEGTCDKRC